MARWWLNLLEFVRFSNWGVRQESQNHCKLLPFRGFWGYWHSEYEKSVDMTYLQPPNLLGSSHWRRCLTWMPLLALFFPISPTVYNFLWARSRNVRDLWGQSSTQNQSTPWHGLTAPSKWPQFRKYYLKYSSRNHKSCNEDLAAF